MNLVSGVTLSSVPLFERLLEVLDETLLITLSGGDDFAGAGESLGEGDDIVEAEAFAKLQNSVDSVELSVVNLLSMAHQKFEAVRHSRVGKRDRSDIAIRAVDAERAVRTVSKRSINHAEVC